MPWDSGAEFARRHNKKLEGHAAEKAKAMAETMIAAGVPEGVAIATANKKGNALNRQRRRKRRRHNRNALNRKG